ncbi:MAG: Sporulation initiation inhibitor protein Soj [Candidatus Saccharibacteria bacterium]|nr:Sporulation initiation inhibitor protein Soj [Candidatus Saccharibacteria bacterium]
MSQVIAVLNQKGGVGKTTSAVNVAAYLAKEGKSVLIVDFDPQGNATSGLGIDKHSLESTIYDVLFDNANTEAVIKETSIAGLYILPANASLANAEVHLVDQLQRELKLKKALQNLNYDFILIDCPPALGLLTVNALAASDLLLIPVQAEYYALEGLSQLLSVVQQVKQGLNTNLELLGVVVTMYDSRTSLSDQVYKELTRYFEDKVFKTIIPRNVRLAEAPSHGKSIVEHDKWSKGARAYKQLTKEVLKRV